MAETPKVRQRIRRFAAATALAGIVFMPQLAAAQGYSPEEIERINREYQQSLEQLKTLKKAYSGLPKEVPAAVPVPAPVAVTPPPMAAPMVVVTPEADPAIPMKAPPVVEERPLLIPTPSTVRTPSSPPVKMQYSGGEDENLPVSMKVEPKTETPVPAAPAGKVVLGTPWAGQKYPVRWEEPAPIPQPVVAPPMQPRVEAPVPPPPPPPVPLSVVVPVPAVVAVAPAPVLPPKETPSPDDVPASMRLLGRQGPVELPPEPMPAAALPEAPVAELEPLPEPVDTLEAEAMAPAPETPEGPPSLAEKLPEPELPEGAPSLPEATSEFLENIPAAALSTHEKDVLHVREPVTIDRMQASSVFPPQEDEPELGEGDTKPIGRNDPSIRDDVGLRVQVKQKDMTAFENLKSAREALYAGQAETAIALYKRVLEAEPQNKDALFGLGTAYQVSGQVAQARELYQQLIMLDQNYWPALNNLFILASEEAPDDALRHLQELQKVNPRFAPIPAQIGMIHLQKGNYEEAARNLGRAAVLDPENLRYRFDLALLLEHVGDTKTAGMLYRQILEAGIAGKELPEPAPQIQARLERAMAKGVTGE